jgi:uncharacterized protein with NRDE domain
MCLVSVAFNAHPDYPLILIGNRDEYHARPSAAADWWDDPADVLGGRDLEAGGTWLAVSRQGRVGVVTNRPDLPAPDEQALSRGNLVLDGVAHTNSQTLEHLPEKHHRYGGCSLVLASAHDLTLYTGGNGTGFEAGMHKPGIIGLSNTAVTQPWPKVDWLTGELHRLVSAGKPESAELMRLLSREEAVPESASHGVPATPFVLGEAYGTRCSTLVMLNQSGNCLFQERRYGPNGRLIGAAEFSFETRG